MGSKKLNKRFSLIIDQERCIGCEACTVACSNENRGAQGWIRVETLNVNKKDTPQGQFPKVSIEPDIELALDGADVVMALRLQRERQQSGLLPSLREYIQRYQLNESRLAKAKPDCLVLHPGPINEGVEISPGVAHGPQSAIKKQVTNGVAVRMALLYLLAGNKEQ